jgi:hypothetical protein
MSFIPEIKGVGENSWVGNGLRFATAGEAINYAIDLQNRWMGCKAGAENRRAVESDDPVTHRWTRQGLVTKETTS